MVDESRKVEILAAAEAEGVTGSARRFGVSPNTIKSWRRRALTPVETPTPAVRAEDAQGMGDEEWIAEMRRDSRETYKAAMALKRAQKRALAQGKTTGARDLAVGYGCMLDQSSKLSLFADQAEARLGERREGIDADRAQIMVAAIETFMVALGLPFGSRSPSRRVLGEILRSAQAAEGMSAPEPAAAEAREEIRRTLLQRALPVASEPNDEVAEGEVVSP